MGPINCTQEIIVPRDVKFPNYFALEAPSLRIPYVNKNEHYIKLFDLSYILMMFLH